ncbi:MAG: ankyrin repeat domain-containing protein [Elusimicrobia bacterium]|nr:ankyrin repeat domain-containing protein [Elusimicrobiota bacterium]
MRRLSLALAAGVALALPILLAGCSSPLIQASTMGDTQKVLALLGRGAHIETKQMTGCRMYARQPGAWAGMETPLICAAVNGRYETVKALLDRGADINARDFTHSTALMYSAMLGYMDVVELLLARGADEDMKNKEGVTALQIARQKGFYALADLFQKEKAMGRVSARRQALAQAAAPGPDKEEMQRMMEEAAKKAVQAIQPPKPAADGAPGSEAAASGTGASDVDRPSYRLAENAENYGLVIGVEKYETLPKADFAEKDAAAVKDHLLALGYPQRNVVFLAGPQASYTNIKKYVESWLPARVREGSTVFVYFSGHGAPDPASGEAYLVPYSGDPEFLQDTGYPMKRLHAKLNALKAKHVILAMDSCFSGAGGRSVLAKGIRPLVAKIEAWAGQGGKVVTLAASASNQISGTVEEQGHGAFTYFLLKGLNGAAADPSGGVTVRSLFDYLVPKVSDAARLRNRDQTPQLLRSDLMDPGLRIR